MAEEYLVLMDTDHIHEYVFGTGELKEIRGGSLLLAEINERETVSLLPKTTWHIARGGGLITILQNREAAEQLIADVRQLYFTRTASGSVTGISVPMNAREFSDVLAQAQSKLWQAKRQRYLSLEKDEFVPWQAGTGPLLQRCRSCGKYPAVRPDTDRQPLCVSCRNKRLKADAEKVSMTSGTWRESVSAQVKFWKMARELQQNRWTRACLPPDDLGELGELSSPQNFLGLIYADGNEISKTLVRLRTKASIKLFSEAVENALVSALCLSIDKHLEPRRKKQPFLPVLLGGDDLVLIVVADAALQIANDLCAQFPFLLQEKIKENMGTLGSSDDGSLRELLSSDKQITLSAGVAVTKAKSPIFATVALAEQLCRSAKRRASEKSKSAVDFHFVGSSAVDLESARGAAYERQDGVDRFSLTARPYVAGSTLEALLETPAILRQAEFPRNKLATLRQLTRITKDVCTDEFGWTYRQLDRPHQDILRERLVALAGVPPPDLFRQVRTHYYESPLLDLVEVCQFMWKEGR